MEPIQVSSPGPLRTSKLVHLVNSMDINMHVDYKLKKLVVKYLIVRDPTVLTDNFHQSLKMATPLEKRLERDGMLNN